MQSEGGSPRRAAASPSDATKQEISDIRRQLKKIMADPVISYLYCTTHAVVALVLCLHFMIMNKQLCHSHHILNDCFLFVRPMIDWISQVGWAWPHGMNDCRILFSLSQFRAQTLIFDA